MSPAGAGHPSTERGPPVNLLNLCLSLSMSRPSPTAIAAAYLHSATNNADQLANQERLVRTAAARDGFTLDEHMIFRERRDGGEFGPLGNDPGRPVLSAFIADIEAGRLTCARLYVLGLDRLARDWDRAKHTVALLRSHGVEVVPAYEGASAHDSSVHELMAMLNSDELLEKRMQHSRLVRLGLARRAARRG